MVVRPNAELFAILLIGPAGLVSSLHPVGSELPDEVDLLRPPGFAVGLRHALGVQFDKVAVDGVDLVLTLRRKPA